MPLPKPAFFQSDKRPQWRSALAGLAIGLRLRFRKNPGFSMAAAAGSIGLLLALFLLLNGGLARFSKGQVEEEPTVSVDLGDDEKLLPAQAGEDKEKPGNKHKDSLASLEKRSSSEHSHSDASSAHASPSSRDRDEPLLGDDESHDADSEVSVVSRSNDSRPTREPPREEAESDPFNSDRTTGPVEEEEPEQPASRRLNAVPSSTTIADLYGDSEEEQDSIADDSIATLQKKQSLSSPAEEATEKITETEKVTGEDTEVAVKEAPLPPKAHKPEKKPERLFSDDEPLGGSTDDEEPQPASRPATTVVKTPSKSSPPVPPIGETDDGSFVPPQSKPAESTAPAGSPQPKSGWKYSTTKPQDAPRESSGRSQAVETAVYAAPEATPSAAPPKRVPEPTSPRKEIPVTDQNPSTPLALAIKAPRNVSPGQTFDIEFVVTNTSREAVRGVILSVLLPAGLAHDLGPELEQPIEMLAAGQSHRARLRVKATGAGDLTPRGDVTIKGHREASSTTTLRVGASDATGRIPPCACEPPIRYVW